MKNNAHQTTLDMPTALLMGWVVVLVYLVCIAYFMPSIGLPTVIGKGIYCVPIVLVYLFLFQANAYRKFYAILFVGLGACFALARVMMLMEFKLILMAALFLSAFAMFYVWFLKAPHQD